MQLDQEDGPLTEAEKMKEEIKRLENTSVTTKKETVAGLTLVLFSKHFLKILLDSRSLRKQFRR